MLLIQVQERTASHIILQIAMLMPMASYQGTRFWVQIARNLKDKLILLVFPLLISIWSLMTLMPMVTDWFQLMKSVPNWINTPIKLSVFQSKAGIQTIDTLDELLKFIVLIISDTGDGIKGLSFLLLCNQNICCCNFLRTRVPHGTLWNFGKFRSPSTKIQFCQIWSI